MLGMEGYLERTDEKDDFTVDNRHQRKQYAAHMAFVSHAVACSTRKLVPSII